MERISILHITDLHFEADIRGYATFDIVEKVFRGRKASYDPIMAEMLAQWIWENKDKFHAILITGDLANTGHADDLERALQYIYNKSPSHIDYPWLSESGVPNISSENPSIIILPGNHDRFQKGHIRKPGNIEFDNVFEKYWTKDSKVRASNGNIFLENNPNCGLSVICVDFSLNDKNDAESKSFGLMHRRGLDYLGQGYVYKHIMDDLEDVTNKVREQLGGEVPVIWALHFSIRSKKQSLKLLNEELLIEKAKELNIPYLISGHTHEMDKKSLDHTGLSQSIVGGSPVANFYFYEKEVNNFQVIDFNIEDSIIKNVNITPVHVKDNFIEPWNFSR